MVVNRFVRNCIDLMRIAKGVEDEMLRVYELGYSYAIHAFVDSRHCRFADKDWSVENKQFVLRALVLYKEVTKVDLSLSIWKMNTTSIGLIRDFITSVTSDESLPKERSVLCFCCIFSD